MRVDEVARAVSIQCLEFEVQGSKFRVEVLGFRAARPCRAYKHTVLSSEPHAMCPSNATSIPTKFFWLECPANVRMHADCELDPDPPPPAMSVPPPPAPTLPPTTPRLTSHNFSVLSVDQGLTLVHFPAKCKHFAWD